MGLWVSSPFMHSNCLGRAGGSSRARPVALNWPNWGLLRGSGIVVALQGQIPGEVQPPAGQPIGCLVLQFPNGRDAFLCTFIQQCG